MTKGESTEIAVSVRVTLSGSSANTHSMLSTGGPIIGRHWQTPELHGGKTDCLTEQI